MSTTNSFGQAIGDALPQWKVPPYPAGEPLFGRYCELQPLAIGEHAADLYEAYSGDNGSMWTYLPYGPFATFNEYRTFLHSTCLSADPLFYAIFNPQTKKPVGVAAYQRITPASGSIEVGHLAYSPLLQRTPASTEAMYLMMKRAFELGYRRYEWKCDALNAPSSAAALRLGFKFEGIFRQAIVYKGRTRDTAWYSIIDSEWPALKAAFEKWLAPENFDAAGKQKAKLQSH